MIASSQIDRFVDVASGILGASRVLTDHATCIAHSYDAYLFESIPQVVVFPQTTNDVRALVEAANSTGLPYVARGAGTGYAGGAVATSNGVVISLQDMNRILEFNDEEGWVLAQPGVITGTIADQVRTRGWRYPPDPSSFRVSTIGGNIATNAGGPHCLGYGVTSNYVLEIEVVTPEGRVVRLGGQTSLQEGLDLRGLYIGSEGTFGIVTSARLRLIRQPPCVHTYIATFPNIEAAISAMESIFRQAILPIALELIWSALIPTVNGCEARGETFMFIELEGPAGDVQAELAGIAACVAEHMGVGSQSSKATLMETRLRVTIDRVRETRKEYAAKRYFLFDAVVPRDRLLTMMRVIEHICRTYQFPITNTFHAGDGNIHPALFFSNDDADIESRLSHAWLDLLNTCAEVGGALTGEHGVGVEKRAMMQKFFDRDALQLMHSLREQLGNETCNPHKIVPPTSVLNETPPRRPGPYFHEERIFLDFPAAHMEVGCDVTLAEVIDVLAPSPYQLPYYPIVADSDETLCNLIVRGCPSFKELRFGCPRDLVVGGLLTALSGKQVRLGGIINKDVGGYELRKLIFNSRGKIGNLQRLILKLAPRPRAVTRLSVDNASVKMTLKWMRELFFSTWGLSALFLRSAGTGVALEVIIEGSSETVADGQKIVSDVVGTNAHIVVDQSTKLPDHPLRKTAEFRGSSGQPWTLSDHIEGLVQRQIPFLAFAGSRFLLEAVNGAGGVDLSSGADHQTDTLEGKVIRAFELL